MPRKIEISKLQDAANELFRVNKALRSVFVEKERKTYHDTEPFKQRVFPVLHFDSKEELDKYGEIYGTIPLRLPVRIEGPKSAKDNKQDSRPSLTLVKNILVHKIKMFFTVLRMNKLTVIRQFVNLSCLICLIAAVP